MENKDVKQLTKDVQDLLKKVAKKFNSTNSSATLEVVADLEVYEKPRFDLFHRWFDNAVLEAKLNPNFAIVGQRGCFSRVAIWFLQERDLTNAPVVIVSSEGEVEVIASDFLTFMAVSALGYDMFQFLESHELTAPWHSKNEVFLDWLKAEYQVEPPTNLTEWLAASKSTNPNLEQTIEAHN